jgi:manganese transport protein
MEGFLDLKMRPWVRRLLTRATALIPAIIVAAVMGDAAVGQLLVISQVILSMQLSFAVFPLVQFTSSKAYVGKHANPIVVSVLAWLVAVFIAGLNVYLLATVIGNKGVP